MAVAVDIPVGSIRLTWWDDLETRQLRMRIDQADPVIHLTAEFLYRVRVHMDTARVIGREPWFRIDWHAKRPVVTITGSNREVIYCIDDYDPQKDLFLAVWPD